jgi:diguanylate cyclase (GGDEF)-like protein
VGAFDPSHSPDNRPVTAAQLTVLARLGAMFERTASVRSPDDLQIVLEDVCRTISEVLGYGCVVVNVYRPAFDDMLTAAVVGSEESVNTLFGLTSPRDTWTPLLADRFERRGAYFVPGDEFDWDALGVETYVPDLEPIDDPDAWNAEDALFVPLTDTNGELLGVVSVDEPETGRRPSDDALDALVTIARHAALALRIAQDTANDVEHQRMLERVLEVSARLAEAEDTEEILQAVCDGIQDALGFDKVVIELADGPEVPMAPVAASGWGLDEANAKEGVSLQALEQLFTDEFEVAGCYLVPADVAQERLGVKQVSHPSELNGRGPHAWSRHWLMVPLAEPEGGRIGVIWVDDPRDRLLPSHARLQTLRLFANQAVAALQSADQAVRLRHEALHDTLTGLPNRRAFVARLAREAAHPGDGFALILCDMDNLKEVNDSLGHEAGDLALRLLADALKAGLRRSDEAYRLGGDEFAVVLPGASRLDAERVSRRLAAAVSVCAKPPLTAVAASFGIAVRDPGETPEELMARADGALYRAKRRRRTSAA